MLVLGGVCWKTHPTCLFWNTPSPTARQSPHRHALISETFSFLFSLILCKIGTIYILYVDNMIIYTYFLLFLQI